jgi:site-specific recombinase XerD
MAAPRRTQPELTITSAIDQFTADLRVDKSPRTIQNYRDSAELYARHAASEGITSLADITPGSIRTWLVALREAGRTTSTIDTRYRGLRALLTWAVAENLLSSHPIIEGRIRPAKVQAKPIPLLTQDQLRALLRACGGQSFDDLRDTAAIRLFLDTGLRRAELAGLKGKLLADGRVIGDLDFSEDVATVTGKGNRVRVVPFNPRCAKALRRYLRARYAHPHGDLPDLWIGPKGALHPNALLLMLRRRAVQAGIGHIFVHQLRHVWADDALRSGMNESDVMRLGGWRSTEMLRRYGASGADERARLAKRAVSLSDRL